MLRMVLGFFLGLLREACVIFYYKAIARNQAYLGSLLTLCIALLDVGVIAKLALDRDIMIILGYSVGESIGTFLILKLEKQRNEQKEINGNRPI